MEVAITGFLCLLMGFVLGRVTDAFFKRPKN